MKNKQLNYIGNQKGDVLIINEKIKENNKIQDLHNLFFYRLTNKNIIYDKDFLVVKPNKASIFLDTNDEISIIIVSNDQIELSDYGFIELQDSKWNTDDYTVYMNLNKSKIAFKTKKFEELSFDILNEIKNDITIISSLDEFTSKVFRNRNKEIIYYQYDCSLCDEFNLTILHRSEPSPKTCKHCKQSIYDSNGRALDDLLILENGKLYTKIRNNKVIIHKA